MGVLGALSFVIDDAVSKRREQRMRIKGEI